MEGLEALERLKDNYHAKRDVELFNIIMRDLEILDILKEVIKEHYGNISGWVEFDLDYEDNLDEKGTLNAKKIKEWLENDK